jgi:hypothetical protein
MKQRLGTLDKSLHERPGVRLCRACKLWKTPVKFAGKGTKCRECCLATRLGELAVKTLERRGVNGPRHGDTSVRDSALDRLVPLEERCDDCSVDGHPERGPFLTKDGTRVCARHLKRRVKERRSA